MDRMDITCNAADRVAVDETGCGAVITAHYADHDLTAEDVSLSSISGQSGRLSLSKNMSHRSAGEPAASLMSSSGVRLLKAYSSMPRRCRLEMAASAAA